MIAPSSPSPEPPSPVTIPITPLSSTETSVSVLVIDDDRDIREILDEILVSEGYSVVTAGNGVEALESLKNVKPSLILLDLNMPVMDGFEFRSIQRSDPAIALIPTVVISALYQMRQLIVDLAVDDALAKPVALEHLLRVVRRYCESPS